MNNKQLEQLNIDYFSKYEPCPLTLRCGEKIYIKPIKMQDAEDYFKCVNLFNYEKDKIIQIKKRDKVEVKKQKIQAIMELKQMSYLEFLLRIIFPNNLELLNNLARLLEMIIGEKYIYCYNDNGMSYVDNKGKPCICIGDENGNLKYYINKSDFDDIKQIVLNQNNSEYDNREMSDDVREIVELYYKTKLDGLTSPSLEKQKIYVMCKMQYTYDVVQNMYLRMFLQVYNMLLDLETNLTNNILKSGFQASEWELKHPLFQPKKDFIADAFTTKDTINKIKNSL